MNCKVQKYRVLVMGLLILSLMGLSACGRQESTANVPKLKDPVGVDVDTAKVKKMNLSSVNSYSGEVVPDMVGAYFANSGQAGAVKVEIGDKVKKGQLLATLTGSESTVKDLQKELESQIAENAETNASSQSKIEQLNIELKAVKKQKKQAKNTKDKNNLGKQIVQKQEEIKTERLRLKLQKQTQKQTQTQIQEQTQAFLYATYLHAQRRAAQLLPDALDENATDARQENLEQPYPYSLQLCEASLAHDTKVLRNAHKLTNH